MRQLLRTSLTRVARRAYSSRSIDYLKDRGFVSAVTSDHVWPYLAKKPTSVYLGMDPSAPSLHVGNLLGLVCLLHFQICGHKVMPLIGGGTGRVGDPGGRTTERTLLGHETVEQNIEGITQQVKTFFDRSQTYVNKRIPTLTAPLQPPEIMNNISWLQNMPLLDFLRDVGKHAKVNVMVTKDSVKTRLQTGQGLSFTEFSYQLLQAYDFFVLHSEYGCSIQLGGSDQWGNIVGGIDLIKRRRGPEEDAEASSEPAYGITMPLLTTPSGEKFGKSAGNAVWLDAKLTSVFDFYQFFVKMTDAEVEKYLKLFTLLPLETVNSIMEQHAIAPEKRLAQRTLASEVTELVHGEIAVPRVLAATTALFNPNPADDLDPDAIIAALAGTPRLVQVPRDQVVGQPLTKLASRFNLTKTRVAANQLVTSGGFYMNGLRISNVTRTLDAQDLMYDRIVILRAGKDSHLVIAVT